jgi:hypothetical protein
MATLLARVNAAAPTPGDPGAGGPVVTQAKRLHVSIDLGRTLALTVLGVVAILGAVALWMADKPAGAMAVFALGEAIAVGGLGVAYGEQKGAIAAGEQLGALDRTDG